MSTESNIKPPLNPHIVLLVSILLPGMGQVLNQTPTRGLMMLFVMLMLGVITFNLAAPGISMIGKFSGGIFIYTLSVMDAYYWARYRSEHFKRGA